MTWQDRLTWWWLLVFFPAPLVPALAWAQEGQGEILVEAGTPVPVSPADVADRLRAELPDASVRVASRATAGVAGTVTMALTPAGTLQVVYRDAAGREATRIVADTHDPSAVAAAVAMIVANLHRSQLETVLGPVAEPPVVPPPPGPAPPVDVPVPVPVPDPAQRALLVRANPAPNQPGTGTVTGRSAAAAGLVAVAAPSSPAGWVLDAGGLYAVVAASAVVGVGYDLSARVRLGVRGNLAWLPADGSTAFTLDLALTRLGQSRPGRFDFGAQGGLLAVDDGTTLGAHLGPFASYLYAVTPSLSIGARVGVDVALIDGEATIWPTAALVCELPL